MGENLSFDKLCRARKEGAIAPENLEYCHWAFEVNKREPQ
jgi:hypothetical protein